MKQTDVDLTLESNAKLIRGDELAKRKWLNNRFLFMGGGIAVILGGVLVLLLVFNGEPNDLENLLVIIIMGLGGSAFISQLLLLLRGNKAPKDPLETISRFYTNTLREHNVGSAGYLYLLDQAKAQFGSMENFVNYYNKVLHNNRRDILRHFGCIGWENNYKLANIEEIDSADFLKTYALKIEATLTTGGDGRFPLNVIGKVNIEESCTVADVGGRWYLTSGMWTGVLQENIFQGTKEEESYMIFKSLDQDSKIISTDKVLLIKVDKLKIGGIPWLEQMEEYFLPIIGPLAHKLSISVVFLNTHEFTRSNELLSSYNLDFAGKIYLMENGHVLKYFKGTYSNFNLRDEVYKALKIHSTL